MNFRSEINDGFYKMIEAKNKEKENIVVDHEEQAKFLNKIAKGDPKARSQFTNALTENVTLAIPAKTMFGQFLEMGTFTPDRRTWYYTIEENDVDIDDELEVYRIYRNGNAPRAEILTDESYVQIQPYQITSEEYYMEKFALELGVISEPTKLQNKASENITWKLETDAETILTNGLYNDLNAITGINISNKISNFPTSNKLDLSSYGGMTLNTLKDIAVYAKRIGRTIETIYAPVSVETDMWDWLGQPENFDTQDDDAVLPSNVVPKIIKDKLVTEGVPGKLFGRNFTIESVNTLNDDATEGDIYLWVKFGGGGGAHLNYLQGGNFSDDYSHEDANKIYYSLKKTLMIFQTPKQRVNYARVKIQNEA